MFGYEDGLLEHNIGGLKNELAFQNLIAIANNKEIMDRLSLEATRELYDMLSLYALYSIKEIKKRINRDPKAMEVLEEEKSRFTR